MDSHRTGISKQERFISEETNDLVFTNQVLSPIFDPFSPPGCADFNLDEAIAKLIK
jgi:hypothetical protein